MFHTLFCFSDIFPSNMEEEQPLRSLIGKFYGMHSHVGGLIFRDVMPSILSNEGIFFYSHNYTMPREDGGYGCLEEIPLPPLSGQEWPTPDAWTVISLKTRMANDILASLKYTQASRSVCLNWACPIHVFACMFHAMNCKENPGYHKCSRTLIYMEMVGTGFKGCSRMRNLNVML